MNVVLETNALHVSQAGVARYLRGLLRGFAEMGDAAPRITTLAWEVDGFDYRQPARALRTLYRELVWPRLVAPSRIRAAKPDLLHRTAVSLDLPIPRDVPEIASLYDLAVFRHPEKYRRWQRLRESRLIHRLHDAAHVICISEFTAREATELLGLRPEQMTVVHLANSFEPGDAQPDEIPPDLLPPDPFFLFVGSLEPGKNLRLLQSAYADAEAAGHPLPSLVVVGARREGVEAEGPAPARWRYAGRLSDGAIQALYERALALVFPSKYEGFGIPVLEAMALGCPVICSRLASLPEVGGHAALYAEQTPDAYRDAMQKIAGDASLRSSLATRGREQAAKFSWRRCAEETTQVYRKVAGHA